MAIRPIRHQRQAPLDERDRFVVPSLLMREYTGIVQRVRMIGGHLEHPPIQLLRLYELLIFLQKDGECDRLLERQFARRRF